MRLNTFAEREQQQKGGATPAVAEKITQVSGPVAAPKSSSPSSVSSTCRITRMVRKCGTVLLMKAKLRATGSHARDSRF
jgi:hypothetical protein